MVWRICFGAALILLGASSVVYLISRGRGKKAVRYLGIGVFLASVFVCVPVIMKGESFGFALIMSISHSIRMFVIDTGAADIVNELPAESLGNLWAPYKALVCALYLLAPVFTLAVVLQYFSNSFEYLRLRIKGRRNLFIFSELNMHSLEIASDIWNYTKKSGKKAEIVFCCSDQKDSFNLNLEENARKLNAILLPEEIMQLRVLNPKRMITCFMISDNEDENVECTLQMIDSIIGKGSKSRIERSCQKNIEIFCYTTNAEAEILLDGKEKQDLRVVLADEVRDAVYEQLYEHPLYTNLNLCHSGEQKITLLIAGAGKVGTEFLKAAIWCGQMKGFGLEIHMIDKKGESVREKLEEECPELFLDSEKYRIYIHQGNIFSRQIRDCIEGLEYVNYCVASFGDDEATIRASIWLRRYFYSVYSKEPPFICAYIQSKSKKDIVWELCEGSRNKTPLYYNIVPFGNGKMYYGSCSDAAFMLEYMGLGIQAHYFNLTGQSSETERRNALEDYYQKQYNRRSSIASGMHISTKLWEMGYGILRVPDKKEEFDLFKECVKPIDFYEESRDVRQAFYNLEHERWMAYVRTEGWRLATRGDDSLEDIRECYRSYCGEFRNQNYLMKMHPALVPLESDDPRKASLQEVEDMITAVNVELDKEPYSPKYAQSDVKLVDQIGEIVDGAWCGTEGIYILGTMVKKGECVICCLQDMLHYYIKVYEMGMSTSREKRNLAEKIRRCCYGIIQTETCEGCLEEAYRCLAQYKLNTDRQ